ncbi:S-protein homolog 3-like [Carya illinoinensis]|uniref:S-protein homolog n=1 Tax=Carya illinoinensis TaxID=32201 RepID=A0A8T1NLT5_CARIL|nr:S-protein homolog 3-like [Carya illinoinensis]KAG6629847.1 hypothetical protein CIPAW_14G113500 [Carya illinoinensis]
MIKNMRSSSSSKVVLLLMLQLVFFLTTFDMVAGRNRAHVRISNELDVGLDLKLHCKSEDNDLGEHLLHYNDSYYEFSFRPNLFGETLFYCSFEWNADDCPTHHWFNIYEHNRDSPRCSECYWKVHLNGSCMLNYDHNINLYDLCYPWKDSRR